MGEKNAFCFRKPNGKQRPPLPLRRRRPPVHVVRRAVERHEALQERLGGAVAGEEGVPVDRVQLALPRVGQPGGAQPGQRRSAVQAEQRVEPGLEGVARGVAHRLGEAHLAEEAPRGCGGSRRRPAAAAAAVRVGGRAVAQLGDEFEAEGSAGALVAVDGGAEEHEVGAEHGAHQRQRDGGRLVDHQQLRGGAGAGAVLRGHVLHRLAVGAEQVHAHNRLAERGVGGLHQLVVQVLLATRATRGEERVSGLV